MYSQKKTVFVSKNKPLLNNKYFCTFKKTHLCMNINKAQIYSIRNHLIGISKVPLVVGLESHSA